MTLSPINSPTRRRKFETYDFEWIPGTLQMRLCGRYGPNGYVHYPDVDTFLANTLTYSNRSKWFFAHAGGLADVQFIFEKLIEDPRYVVEAAFSGSSAIIVKVKRDKHIWLFCDSFWLFRDSLANIGRAMGLDKTGPSLDPSMTEGDIKEWYRTVPLEELIPYNSQDCLILYTAIHAFQELLLQEGSLLQKTIASCGMTLFRRSFLSRPIRTNEGVNTTSRFTYHASRVEKLSDRCVNAFYFDINSSFPFSMTKPQPGEMIRSHLGLPDRLIGNPNRCYIVKADITVPDTHFPAMPYRHHKNNRLFFPCGTWTSWFTDVDFELMIEEGYEINAIFESVEFDTFNDLGDYALNIYHKRKTATDPFMKILYKYLMNSVYGKMAERPEKQKLWVNPDDNTILRLDEKYNGIENCHVRGSVFIEDIILPLQHVHVPVSARITALSRKLIYDLMAASAHCYYCDTDGFATDDDFPTGDELGELKMEKKIINGNFYAPKVYRLDIDIEGETDIIVHAKGFSLGKQDTPEKKKAAIKRFNDIVDGKSIAVERMSRIKENIRTRNAPIERVVKKAMSDNVIPKRFFYPDGESRPWDVEEIKGMP